MSFLEKIVESQKEKNQSREPESILFSKVTHEERTAIRRINWDQENLNVIAEIKRKSPSKGELAEIPKPGELASVYEDGGANVISVLTNEEFFGAKVGDFQEVRSSVQLPVLRKDFAVDIGDVYETYLIQADMMLLIVAAFKDVGLLAEMHLVANELGLCVLVETHNEAEVEVANEIDAKIIGVNVRDLVTFNEDPDLGARLIKNVRSDAIPVWESCIQDISSAQKAVEAQAKAVLVGQGLVQSENPREFIQQMRNIAC